MISKLLIADRGEIACRVVACVALTFGAAISATSASAQLVPGRLLEGDPMNPQIWRLAANEGGFTITRNEHSIVFFEDCTVRSNIYGSGVWGQANGGIAIQFEGHRQGFPRQNLPWPEADCDTP